MLSFSIFSGMEWEFTITQNSMVNQTTIRIGLQYFRSSYKRKGISLPNYVISSTFIAMQFSFANSCFGIYIDLTWGLFRQVGKWVPRVMQELYYAYFLKFQLFKGVSLGKSWWSRKGPSFVVRWWILLCSWGWCGHCCGGR